MSPTLAPPHLVAGNPMHFMWEAVVSKEKVAGWIWDVGRTKGFNISKLLIWVLDTAIKSSGDWILTVSRLCSFPQTVIDDARSVLLPHVNSFLPQHKNSFLRPWSINQELRTWLQREMGAQQKFKKCAMLFFIFVTGAKFLFKLKNLRSSQNLKINYWSG